MKATLVVHRDRPKHVVSRYLYSEFVENIGRCVYEGVWVGADSPIPSYNGLRRDVVDALAALKLPVLRWPGGCFADCYHWEEGIGPRSERPVRTTYYDEIETNEFGTHEFMELCEAVGAEAYIALNVGTGSPQEARDWVEYLTGKNDTTVTRKRAANGRSEPWNVPFFGIGNESWMCGGWMRAERYADMYRNYASYVQGVAPAGSKLIACGSHPGLVEGGLDWDASFLDSLSEEAHVIPVVDYGVSALSLVDFVALHNYTWVKSSLEYSDDAYFSALENVEGMRAHLEGAIEACNRKSTESHPIGVILDEWGIWYLDKDPAMLQFQQATMLDAVFAAASLHMLHDIPNLFMANLSSMINVLQSLILTDGPRVLRTPSYHIWEMFMPHRDSTLLECEIEGDVSASATISDDGTITLSIVNTSLTDAAELGIAGATPTGPARVLTSGNVRDHNSFESPDLIVPTLLDGMTLPPHSVAVFTLG